MKKIAKIFVIVMLVLTSTAIFAQVGDPPDPNDGADPGSDNTPVGGRASVSGGLIVLLALGAGYGAKKVYELKTKTIE